MKRLVFLFLLALVALLVWTAGHLRANVAMYPLFVTIGGFVSLTAYFAQSFRGLGRGETGPAVAISWSGGARIALFIAVWITYVLLLPAIGFLIATWLALVISYALVAGRTAVVSLLATAVFVIVLFVLTKTVLYIPVPAMAPERWATTLIYQVLG